MVGDTRESGSSAARSDFFLQKLPILVSEIELFSSLVGTNSKRWTLLAPWRSAHTARCSRRATRPRERQLPRKRPRGTVGRQAGGEPCEGRPPQPAGARPGSPPEARRRATRKSAEAAAPRTRGPGAAEVRRRRSSGRVAPPAPASRRRAEAGAARERRLPSGPGRARTPSPRAGARRGPPPCRCCSPRSTSWRARAPWGARPPATRRTSWGRRWRWASCGCGCAGSWPKVRAAAAGRAATAGDEAGRGSGTSVREARGQAGPWRPCRRVRATPGPGGGWPGGRDSTRLEAGVCRRAVRRGQAKPWPLSLRGPRRGADAGPAAWLTGARAWVAVALASAGAGARGAAPASRAASLPLSVPFPDLRLSPQASFRRTSQQV